MCLGKYLKKVNMIVEVFVSDFGKHLLVYLSNFDNNLQTIQTLIIGKEEWCDIDFKVAFKWLKIIR